MNGIQFVYKHQTRDDFCAGCVEYSAFAAPREVHDNALHHPHFIYHAVVAAANMRWDPSYGMASQGPPEIDEAANPVTNTIVSGSQANTFLFARNIPLSALAQLVDMVCNHDTNAEPSVQPSVPSQMVAGLSHVVTITMRNNGTETWEPEGFALVAVKSSVSPPNNPFPDNTWGTNLVALGTPVNENGAYSFNVTITAPTVPGTYEFRWRMATYDTGAYGVAAVPFGTPTHSFTVTVVPAQP